MMHQQQPWYFEGPQGRLFNEWSLAHVLSGFLWARLAPRHPLAGLAAHTGYEAVEGNFFPDWARDRSMRNHVGDSAAFLVGMRLGS